MILYRNINKRSIRLIDLSITPLVRESTTVQKPIDFQSSYKTIIKIFQNDGVNKQQTTSTASKYHDHIILYYTYERRSSSNTKGGGGVNSGYTVYIITQRIVVIVIIILLRPVIGSLVVTWLVADAAAADKLMRSYNIIV